MNPWDLLLAGGILLVLLLAARKLIRDRKRGKCCGCDCGSCGGNCGTTK